MLILGVPSRICIYEDMQQRSNKAVLNITGGHSSVFTLDLFPVNVFSLAINLLQIRLYICLSSFKRRGHPAYLTNNELQTGLLWSSKMLNLFVLVSTIRPPLWKKFLKGYSLKVSEEINRKVFFHIFLILCSLSLVEQLFGIEFQRIITFSLSHFLLELHKISTGVAGVKSVPRRPRP